MAVVEVATEPVEELVLSFCENLEGNSMLENLRHQRAEGKFCDIVLHVAGKKFSAHRSVLAASSPYFESILKNHKVTQEEINIGWQDAVSFGLLLDYMYTGNVVINESNVFELLKLSNHFLISKLKGYCEEFLDRYMSLDNCIKIKDLAEKYNLTALQESALNIIRDSIGDLLESKQVKDMPSQKLELFMTDPCSGCDTVPMGHLLNALASWVKVDIPKRSLEFHRLLAVINWDGTDPNEVYEHIDRETLYQESKICLYLILRSLAVNNVDITKYADQYKELKGNFEEAMEANEANASEIIVAGSSLDDLDDTKDDLEEVEVVVDDEPITVLPVSQPSATPRARGRRRSNKKRPANSDLEDSVTISKQENTQNEENAEEEEGEATGNYSTRTRRRKIKQRYSSQEWITDEPVSRRRSSDQVEAQRSITSIAPNSPANFMEESMDDAGPPTPAGQTASLAQWRDGIKCPHCAYIGHSATRLEQHMARIHEEDTTYKCRMCDYTCKWNREYYRHMKIHFEGPPYKCMHCEYTCDRIQFILSHSMRHTDERPFHCQLCDFKSRTKGNLLVHMRIHTGEKPYKCQFCDRGFAMKNTLDQHLATHREDRPYLCDTCGFTTKYQSHLLSHKRIHTGNVYRCNHEGCTYFSPRRSQLASHQRSHLSIRSHICVTCGRGFIEKSHLIRHERIHLDDKPFKCDQCDYESTRKDKLKEHSLKHHSANSKSPTSYKPRKPRRQSNVTYVEDSSIQEISDAQLIVTSPQEIQLTQNEQEVATANLIYEYTTGGTTPTKVVIQNSDGQLFELMS